MAKADSHPEHVTDSEALEDAALVTVTEEDNTRIKRKTDYTILVLLTWIYFLQVFDKAVLGTAAVFNLQEDLGLTGSQYSIVASIAPIAQLGWQPFSAWLIVKVPYRILMPTMVLGWGIAEVSICACKNFGQILAARFFLGLFEAGCMPLFTIITGQWYRRLEQPVRIAIWYSMNGTATIAASAISYGMGNIKSDLLSPWQIIFLFAGLITIVSAPYCYWKLDNDVTTARFLTEQEREMAVERLRANRTGATIEHSFKWSHVLEVALEPKSWLWVALTFLPNAGSAISGVFGPLLLKGFGFDAYESLLLNIPFGAIQTIIILLSCWVSYKAKIKGVVLFGFMLPVLAGIGMLYGLGRADSDRPALLAGYYMLAFLFAANPLLLSWVVANTAGATKKSTMLSLYQVGTSGGAMAGPYLFSADQEPHYLPAIRGVLGMFIAMIACIVIQLAILVLLNKLQAKKRVANGKSAVIVDSSMTAEVTQAADGKGEDAETPSPSVELDLTDRENDEFIYLY